MVFKKLYRQLMLTNIILLTVLLLITFTTVYLYTSKSIHDKIQSDIRFLGNMQISKQLHPFSQPPAPQIFNLIPRPPGFIAAFTIDTNRSNSTFNVKSIIDASDSFYEEAYTMAIQDNKESNTISLNGHDWVFLKQFKDDQIFLAFIDVSTESLILLQLFYRLIIIFFLMISLVVIFSSFLTQRSILPIKTAFEQQKQFVSDASHELKTPLSVIGSNVDVLLASVHIDEPQYKWLYFIKREVQRMSKLTTELLTLAQLESTPHPNTLQTQFNYSQVVEHILLGIEVCAFEKGQHFNYEISPHLLIHGNKELISQVVYILVDNAIKYTPSSSHIAVSLTKESHYAVLHVKNDGDQIPFEEREKIFDRFYRLDKARNRDIDSYGLGLPIAKAIIEKHGGKIFCSTDQPGANLFIVKLKTT